MVLISIGDLEINFPPVGEEIKVDLDDRGRKTTNPPKSHEKPVLFMERHVAVFFFSIETKCQRVNLNKKKLCGKKERKKERE